MLNTIAPLPSSSLDVAQRPMPAPLSNAARIPPSETVELIAEAVTLLKRHPLIGRPVEDGIRELVISRGKTSYMALYSPEAEHGAVLILAIGHQRESGFAHWPRQMMVAAAMLPALKTAPDQLP